MTTDTEQRTQHPYHMHDAVVGQPDAIAALLEREKEPAASLAGRLAGAERIHLVGVGTSWHAGLVGEHLLRTIAGREDARAWNSFEFCSYPPALSARDAVVVLSHRGTKLYSAQALELARSAGASTALVTGLGSAARADLADSVVRTSESERSSAFTISHTTAMTALAMVAAETGAIANNPAAAELSRDLEGLPHLMETAMEQEAAVRRWVRQVADSDRHYFTGWGPNASTAYETALKIKETSYSTCEGFQLEQYLHGPFVATDAGCSVTFIAPPGPGLERARAIMAATNATGAYTATVVEDGDPETARCVDNAILMPATPEALTPIVYLLPLQLFTYWLADELGHNPDVFRLDDPTHLAARDHYTL